LNFPFFITLLPSCGLVSSIPTLSIVARSLAMPRRRILLLCPLLALVAFADAGRGQPPATDLYGDPLPPGAVARLGTVRWRHGGMVAFAAFRPDGKSVVSASDDGCIHVWEFPSGKELRRIVVVPVEKSGPGLPRSGGFLSAAALSPDGRTVATSFLSGRISAAGLMGFGGFAGNDKPGQPEQEIHLHDVATGEIRRSLKADFRPVIDLAFSSDGRRLTSRDDVGVVRVWDWAGGKDLGKLASRGANAQRRWTGTDSLEGILALSPDGKTLLVSGLTSVLQVVPVPVAGEVAPGAGHTVPIKSLRFTPDGKHILAQDSDWSVRKWDAATGKDLGPVKQPSKLRIPTAVSPDGRVGVEFSAGSTAKKAPKAGEVIWFDGATGAVLHKMETEPYLGPAMFSPDGKVLAINPGKDQKLELYDVATRKLLHALDVGLGAVPLRGKGGFGGGGPGGFGGPFGRAGVGQAVLFSADGKTLAVYGSQRPATVALFDTTTGQRVGSLSLGDRTPTSSAAFSRDGRCLALEMSDGTVTLYELATGQPRRTYGSKPKEPENVDPKLAAVLAAGFLPAAVGDRGEYQRGPSVRVPPGPRVALAPDTGSLAFAGYDGLVHLWDVLTGHELAAFQGHLAPVSTVAFSPDGKTVASAGNDTTVLIWDATRNARPARPDKVRQPADLEHCWQALADTEAAKAFAAMSDFVAAPKEAVAFLRKRVKPAAAPEKKHVEELIRRLDDAQYKVREKAVNDLMQLGEAILPLVDQVLQANPSSETRKRLESLRGQLSSRLLQGERLRAYRAVEVLERIGTPQARQVLQALADGAPGALITASAQAALVRGGEPRP
jgi:WD40 repeat protein